MTKEEIYTEQTCSEQSRTSRTIVKKYLGIPYEHKGRDLNGLDCWGLILAVYADLGFKLRDIEEDYTQDWSWKDKDYFIENYYKQWQKIDNPQVFDVVLFHNGKGIANHAGVYLGEDKFLHTCKAGTVIGRLSNAKWQKRIEGFYRLNTNN